MRLFTVALTTCLITTAQATDPNDSKDVHVLGFSFTQYTEMTSTYYPQKAGYSKDTFQVLDDSIQSLGTTTIEKTGHRPLGESFRLDICFSGKEKKWVEILNRDPQEPHEQRLSMVVDEMAIAEGNIWSQGPTTYNLNFTMTYLFNSQEAISQESKKTIRHVTNLMKDLYASFKEKISKKQIAYGSCDLTMKQSFSHKNLAPLQKIELSAGTAGPKSDPALKNFLTDELTEALGLGDEFKAALSQRLTQYDEKK